MKTKTWAAPLKTALIALCIGLFVGCSNLSQDDLTLETENSIDGMSWYELIDQFNSPSGIIVTEGESIQEAINVANPGDVIYIAPGVYNERIALKSSLSLFGLNDDSGRTVILENSGISDEADIPVGTEISNIQFKGIQGSGFKTSATKKKEKSNEKFITMHREELGNQVAHYTFDVRLGHGRYERVTLHRLVQESAPYRPVQTQGNIFMVHGANQNFEDIFLIAGETNVTPNSSAASYLANLGVDVWGIDLGWTRVPADETDFSFMEDWGADREISDILKSMTIARVIRGITKQGFDRMNLMGFTYSVALVYPAAGQETQKHWVKRNINGIVLVDGQFKLDPQLDALGIQVACNAAQANEERLANGVYFNPGPPVVVFGQLAAANPDGASPIFQGMTNYQAALFLGANIYSFAQLPTPFWHFVAGVYENGPIPTDLAYSSGERWIQLLAQTRSGPFMPTKAVAEITTCQCNVVDSPLDDYLSSIENPTLYLGSGGGSASQGYYTVDQLTSQDITKQVVSLNFEPTLDFGIGDLFIANNANSEVWELIRQWLLGHN